MTMEMHSTEAVELIAGDRSQGLLFICDHASNRLPAEYRQLGLETPQLQRHIAYDIGAAALTRRLAAHFRGPAVLSTVSRLLIDLNRGADDPTLVMRLSDGAVVPGNRSVDLAEIDRRIARFYQPYHDAIAAELAAIEAAGRAPVIVSLHSFTERWKGRARPWQIGILWDSDDRLARPLIDALGSDLRLTVGDNEPYSGRLEGDCLFRHGTSNGYAHVLVEVRQDLISDVEGEAHWAMLLATALDRILAEPSTRQLLHRRQSYATRTTRTPPPAASNFRLNGATPMTKATEASAEVELQAAVFRRLVAHLQKRSDVQNIDLMTLAGFCRNCLANWYEEAAAASGTAVSRDDARQLIYGMPYDEWKRQFNKEATAEQLAGFKKSQEQAGH